MPAAVAVAASGGRDSTALLHATARAAAGLSPGLQVHALHVHHGLMPEADAWLKHVHRQCSRWARAGLPLHFHFEHLTGQPAPGESVEAWARRGRYQALARMAQAAGCGLVLLAHHRRDQAETLLLQALRGGGPAGLSAMPRQAQRHGLVWARPWLNQPREAVEAYVRRHRLAHIDDGSNLDTRFARNRLRQAVWPSLQAAFPDLEPQLLAAAARAQEASAALQELAEQDALPLAGAQGLRVAAWAALSPARRALALRHWLKAVVRQAVPDGAAFAGVPESLVQRLCQELPASPSAGGRWPAPGAELCLQNGELVLVPRGASVTATTVALPAPGLDLHRPGAYALTAWQGVLLVRPFVSGEGHGAGALDPSCLRKALLRAREGGEQFQAAPRATARSLKKQYQAAGVPAWQRGGPLVFDEQGRLLFVPGLGLDARVWAPPRQGLVTLEWQPDK